MHIIFMTDLDGTFIGHDDFSFDAISAEVFDLIRNGINLIPNSSKTANEIDELCVELGLCLPFICENGAALINSDLLIDRWPYVTDEKANKTFTPSELAHEWEHSVVSNHKNYCIFLENLSSKEHAAILGLSAEKLALALNREYSSLLIFEGSESQYAELCQDVSRAGLALHRGGRVCNLSGAHDKADYCNGFRATVGNKQDTVIVGFGDSDNDTALLEASDIACIIPKPDGSKLALANPPNNLVIAEHSAPLGWLDAARRALSIIHNTYGISHG